MKLDNYSDFGLVLYSLAIKYHKNISQIATGIGVSRQYISCVMKKGYTMSKNCVISIIDFLHLTDSEVDTLYKSYYGEDATKIVF